MPYNVFTKLFESMVWSIVAYGAAIWGTRTFSCIDSIQHRAMRAFLGTTRNAPSAAMDGDMAWKPVFARQLHTVSSYWIRLNHMSVSRFNKQIFNYCYNSSGPRCKNWAYRVKNNFSIIDCNNITNMDNVLVKQQMINNVNSAYIDRYKLNWFNTVNLEHSRNSTGGNKLRTYKLFKDTFSTESYCKMILPRSHRSAFSRFRCGVAPIRLETGRYERLPVCDRVCPFCKNVVENETHVILSCPLYNDIRIQMIDYASLRDPNFVNYTNEQKLVYLFKNTNMIRICAKTCFKILQRRSSFIYR